MKKLLIILFFPMMVYSQAPRVMAQAYSVMTNKSADTLWSLSCDLNCLPIISWAWTKVAGPGTQSVFNSTSPTTIVSGLTTGKYIYQVQAKNSKGVAGIDTVGFIVMLPVDSAGIIAAWVKAHPCPAPIVCPKVDTVAIQALKVCKICPPPVVCPSADSAGIFNALLPAYLAAHPCPKPVPCPKVRVVIKRTTTHTSTGDIDTYLYDDQGTSTVP